ncbi:MAG: MerR family transcriptional regulator [Sphingopyxis sp.]
MDRAPVSKAHDALRTIGEVSAQTGVATHVLRYWEHHVPDLRPLRRAGGRRYYRANDIALVQRLQRLVSDEGYTLDGAARAVRGGGGAEPGHMPVAPASAAPSPAADVALMLTIRARLQSALDAS